MKNLLIAAIVLLALWSCGNKKSNTENVSFPAPAQKADQEILEKQPIVSALKLADPGERSVDDMAGSDLSVDAPRGDADSKPLLDNDDRTGETEQKITKDGDIGFETNNIADTRKRILFTLKRLGGYVVEDKETIDNDANRKDYTLDVRIPAKNFDRLLDFVTTSADKIDSKNISVSDVTTKYIDINTRLNNKKLLEHRYQDLLKKAIKISDLLEIENKLTELRADIESTQVQLNYLTGQVAYSSLAITFYSKQMVKGDKPAAFSYKFNTSLAEGWNFLQNMFFRIIALWPLGLFLPAIFIGYRARKGRKGRLNQSMQL